MKYLAITIALLCSHAIYSQAVVWIGMTDNNWHNAANWSNNAVPTATTSVFINATNPNFEPIVFPGNSAIAQFVNINPDRSLTVNESLTITQTVAAEGLNVQGLLRNYGSITVTQTASESGIEVQGVLENYGSLSVTHSASGDCLRVQGLLENHDDITLSGGNEGLYISATGVVENDGTLDLDDHSFRGIFNSGNLTNDSAASISVTLANSNVYQCIYISTTGELSNNGVMTLSGGKRGIYVRETADLNNFGTINLSNHSDYGIYKIGSGTITNNSAATISVTLTNAVTCLYLQSGLLLNSGVMTLSGAQRGVELVFAGSIDNYGTLNLDNQSVYGIHKTGSGSVINNSAATISVTIVNSNAQYCLYLGGVLSNSGVMTLSGAKKGVEIPGGGNLNNFGTLNLDSQTETGILNGGSFTNNSAAILNVTSVPTGLVNQQTVVNQNMMNFGNVSGPISNAAIVNNASFTNSASITISFALDGIINSYVNIPVSFINHSTINIERMGRNGLVNNSAIFTNNNIIHIDHVHETAFTNNTTSPNPTGEVWNNGSILIGQSGGPYNIALSQLGNPNPTRGALFNKGMMTNSPSGIIKINQSAGYGVHNIDGVGLMNQGSFEIGTGLSNINVSGRGLYNGGGPFTNATSATLHVENTGNTAVYNHGNMEFVNNGMLLIGMESGSVIDGYGVINDEASFHNQAIGTVQINNYTNYGFYSTSPTLNVNQTVINDGQLNVGNLIVTSTRPFVNERVTFTNNGSSHFQSIADYSFMNTSDGKVTNNTCKDMVVNGAFFNGGQVYNDGAFILESNVSNINSDSVVNNGVLSYLTAIEIPNVSNTGTIIHKTLMPGNCVNGMREYPDAFELGTNNPPSDVWIFAGSVSAGTYDLGLNSFIANDNVVAGEQTLYVSFPDLCDKILPWVMNGGGDIDMDGYLDCADLCPDSLDVSLDFDGINDHISVPHDVALNIGSGNFTLQAWVNPTGNSWKTIVSKGAGAPGTMDYSFSINPSSKLALHYAGTWNLGNSTIPSNTWSHVAVSFNYITKQATFYVNGMADGQVSFPAAPDTSDTNSLYIGQEGYGCACNHYEGRLDDVVIWNAAKSPSEIFESMTYPLTGLEPGMVVHYDLNEAFACVNNTATTTVLDNSSNGFNGTVTNFSLTAGCTSNWSSGRNLDSDSDGIGDACNDIPCPISLTLTGNQLSNAIYSSDSLILSNQIILSPATVEYNSAISVELIAPFEVQVGATLTTNNDGCD